MDSKIPIMVQTVLNEFISLFHKQIPNTLEGFYLHGSIALNAYINGSSDVDFIAVISRHLTEEEIKKLADIHRELNSKYKKAILDGCYLLWEDIEKKQTETKRCLYANEGKLDWSTHVMNPITTWILKNNGITIIGPDIRSFHFNVDENALTNYVLNNMNNYWLNRIPKIERLKRIAPILPKKFIDSEVEWSITGVLRQFYTLKEHDIISKLDAGKYTIQFMPDSFHNIIKEAISIREGSKVRYCSSKKQRLNDTIQCMEYIINYCNTTYKIQV